DDGQLDLAGEIRARGEAARGHCSAFLDELTQEDRPRACIETLDRAPRVVVLLAAAGGESDDESRDEREARQNPPVQRATASAETSFRAAATIASASMPAAASNSAGFPEPGISRTARCAKCSSSPARAERTASPSPPSGQWSSATTTRPCVASAASRSVSASRGFSE